MVCDEYEHTYKVTEGELDIEDIEKVCGIVHFIAQRFSV